MTGTSVNHPYFTPDELAFLCDRQRGGKMSETQESKARTQACMFIEAVSARIGFPRATIGTAQTLFHRFYLFFPWRDFSFYDVSMAALYVSSKMHDTLKKPRDLLMVSYAVRFPELAAKAKHGGEIDIDPATLEADRRKLLAVERLVMETVSFNFRVRMPFPYVIKVARDLRAGKYLAKLAWTLSVDSHRTMAPLLFPPHVIAVASIYLAAKLDCIDNETGTPTQEGERTSQEIADYLGNSGPWEQKFRVELRDLEGGTLPYHF
ncbi:cyclin-like protein [Clavulina sp. PMI_390]|nr:cyclin-like protein [Clavulina sp. PMI_390]